MNRIEELYALQEARGFLSDDELRALSRRLKAPLYELEGLASFYPHFRRTPPPALTVGVCRDLACTLRDGGQKSKELAAQCAGRDDVEFAEISCPGLCDRAPVCLVNEVPIENSQVEGVLEDIASLPEASAPPEFPRFETDPYVSSDHHYAELRSVVESRDFDGMIERISASGLRGMGGAGFPTGRKWEIVREEASETKYVICNADESEPGAFKDRMILEALPHLVIEGMVLAGVASGAEQGWVYLRHEYHRPRQVLQRAIDAAYEKGVLGESVWGSGLRFDLRIFVSPGGYVLGEETALLEALEGKRGEPRVKPPFPSTAGLYGKPTLINNVETLAHIPRVLRTGRADLKFFSLSGDVREPGVVEAPLGTTLGELVERVGGMRDGKQMVAFLPGGASTGFLPAERSDIRMDWESLREAGTALGAGAVVVVGTGADLLELGRNLTAFFRNESCGKCVPCRIGTEKAVILIDQREKKGLALLPELNETLMETSICGLGQVALTPILSILENFPRRPVGQGRS